jgi:hypothetical protein
LRFEADEDERYAFVVATGAGSTSRLSGDSLPDIAGAAYPSIAAVLIILGIDVMGQMRT